MGIAYRPGADKKAARQRTIQMFAYHLRPTEAAELTDVSRHSC
jgi:hypothetical protein